MYVDSQKTYNPPYASLGKFEELFTLVETRSFNELTPKNLIARNFSPADASQLLQAFKFLGLLTDDNKTTDDMKVLAMKGEGKEQKLEEIVKNAYKRLYDIAPNAELLSKSQLHDEFMAIYNVSPRIATTAVPAFLWICSKAGMKIAESSPVTSIKNPVSKKSIVSKQKKIKENAIINEQNKIKYEDSYEIISVADTGIKLLIPTNDKIKDEIMAGGLAGARQELIQFAQKVGLTSGNATQGVLLLENSSE